MRSKACLPAQRHDAPVARGEGYVPIPSIWHAENALGDKDAPNYEFGEGDLRAMARMRHTGVSYGDIGWIFGIAAAEARRLIRLYVRVRLGDAVFGGEAVP